MLNWQNKTLTKIVAVILIQSFFFTGLIYPESVNNKDMAGIYRQEEKLRVPLGSVKPEVMREVYYMLDDKSGAELTTEFNMIRAGYVNLFTLLKASEKITDDYWKSHALQAIVKAAEYLDKDKAYTILEKALKIAEEKITDDYWKSHALQAIVKAAEYLDKDKAYTILDRALKIAEEKITSPEQKIRCVSKVSASIFSMAKDNPLFSQTIEEADNLLNTFSSDRKLDKSDIAASLSALFMQGFIPTELKEGALYSKLIRFFSQSGANLYENRAFLKTLTKENIIARLDNISEYFAKLEVSIYLPLAFEKFESLNKQERTRLSDEFKLYYKALARGSDMDTKGLAYLTDGIIEELNFSVIGSTNLTLETYRSTLKEFRSESIPEPKFSTSFRLTFLKGRLILSGLEDIDKAFTKEILIRIKKATRLKPEELLSDIFAQAYSTYFDRSDLSHIHVHALLAPLIKKAIAYLLLDGNIKEALSVDKVNIEALSALIKERLLTKEFDYIDILKQIMTEQQAHPSKAPTDKQVALSMPYMIYLSFMIQPHFKDLLNGINPENLKAEDLAALSEILNEIKPEASPRVRQQIDRLSGFNRLREIKKRCLKTEEGKGVIELEFIPAKTKLDYFYGYFGENCTSENPKELLNERFTPVRIVLNGKIRGAIHTITMDIKGKKSLIICGIEPDTPLASQLDANDFVKKLLDKLSEVLFKEGYEQVLVSTSDAATSDRDNIRDAIKKLIKGKKDVRQDIQKTFPANTKYSITDLKLWKDNAPQRRTQGSAGLGKMRSLQDDL